MNAAQVKPACERCGHSWDIMELNDQGECLACVADRSKGMNFINGQLVRHSRHSGFKLAIVVSLAAGHGYRILVWRAASCKWTTVPKLVDGSELHKLTDEEQRIRGRMITTAVVKAERFRQAFALGEVTL